jgi:DNA-binding transcriptional LysR family regulator
VTQQALSRDVRRLESQVGVQLFSRTTRRVTLTPYGERLLVHARGLLALNDAALEELSGANRPLVVDVIGEGLTAARIIEAARAMDPRTEYALRYGGGLGAALPHVLNGRLDVAFGRAEGLGRVFPAELTRTLVRYEPLALLLLEDHPFARLPGVPLARLRGQPIDASVGNDDAPEWVDLCVALLESIGARPSAAHPHAEGVSETARHLRVQGIPILTMSEFPPVPGAVVRPLVDPVPVYPWSMVHRVDAPHPGIAHLAAAAADLGAREGWLTLPDDVWLPTTDLSPLGDG